MGSRRWTTTRTRWAAMAVAVGTITLAACGSTDEDDTGDVVERLRGMETTTTEPLGQPVAGGQLTVALEAESGSWLPGESLLTTSFRNIAYAIYDPLVVTGADGENHPYLAESITHDVDLLEWTVRLRPGVRFHDGTELDAAAMKTIFDDFLLAPESTALGILDEIEELRVDDELTFTYVLSRPNGAFPYLLAGPIGWPFSPDAAGAAGGDPESKVAGTGPFRIDEWEPNDRLVVSRNPDYWRPGLPHLDSITFRPVPDEQLRVDSLLTGGVDAIQSLRGLSIKAVMADEDEDVVAHTHAGDDASVALMNVIRPPFDDVRIRRAVAHMYDPAALATVLGDDGLVDPSTQFFGADSPWYSERVAAARPKFDPDAARALVSQYVDDPARSDGLPVGTPPELWFTCLTDPSLIEVAELVKRAAEQVGFQASTEHVDTATLVNDLRGRPDASPPFGGDFLTACYRSQHTGDPATTFGTAFGAPLEEAGNLTNFSTPELMRLINELRRTVEFNERYAIVEQIGILVNEAAPLTFVSGTPAMIGARRQVENVTGWTTPEGEPGDGVPYGVTRWGEVWLDR